MAPLAARRTTATSSPIGAVSRNGSPRHAGCRRGCSTAGYAGITYPTEYGGAGLDLDHERVFLEEAAVYDMPTRELRRVAQHPRQDAAALRNRRAEGSARAADAPRGRDLAAAAVASRAVGPTSPALVTRADRDGYALRPQRPEDLEHRRAATPTSPCVRSAPTGTSPSTRASRCSSSTCARPESRSARSARWTAAPSSARSS